MDKITEENVALKKELLQYQDKTSVLEETSEADKLKKVELEIRETFQKQREENPSMLIERSTAFKLSVLL